MPTAITNVKFPPNLTAVLSSVEDTALVTNIGLPTIPGGYPPANATLLYELTFLVLSAYETVSTTWMVRVTFGSTGIESAGFWNVRGGSVVYINSLDFNDASYMWVANLRASGTRSAFVVRRLALAMYT